MSDVEDVKRILGEAEEYAAALDRREERKEVYLMVAGAMLRDFEDTISRDIIRHKAEAIYQEMIRFCGESK